MPQHAKKHHFVPQFLLQHFAGPKGQLVARRERAVPAHARSALAWLLALQWYRSRFVMHVVGKEARNDEYSWVSDELLQTSMMGFIFIQVIEPWRLRNDEDVHFKDRWNPLVSTLLSSSMYWSSYRPRGGGLLVGDNSVCLSGVVGTPPEGIPPAFFDHGVGIGLDNFRRLTLPLSSSLAVIISRDPQDASRLRVADINRYTVFNSREFVAHAPDWAKAHPELARALPPLLERQRTVAPTFLQGYAPGGRN